MSEPITGDCACGAVRYEIAGSFGFSFHCQCRKCQRATGTGHSSAFVVDIADTTLAGQLRYYEQPSDSGYLTRGAFCPVCGSPVFAMTDRFSERRYIHAATLDDPSLFRPERVVFRAEAQPWDHMDPVLP